ncbi:hypothetical protein BurJ1DRAFT_4190 [Burkholderiales bacterium JOSHI_001]|nr:hypothetical protein BurJ1DRAFT_4190 [Burkholderiales bacterium JOSHI_001]
MESAFGTSLGWLLAGVFLGWLGNWLFDRLYRRDGPAAGELTALRLEGLGSEIDGLRGELDMLRRAGAGAAAGAGVTLSLADFPSRVAPQAADVVDVASLAPDAVVAPQAAAPSAQQLAEATTPEAWPPAMPAVVSPEVEPQPAAEPEAPMAKLARLAQAGKQPPWSVQEDAAAKARFEALREFQNPTDGSKPASAS